MSNRHETRSQDYLDWNATWPGVLPSLEMMRSRGTARRNASSQFVKTRQ
ncbi:MAG: hypothetical protein AAFY15_01670 [Cyanobacteria bacterium J06648_11]